ncbi:MAG: TIGR01777 family protein [Desulfobulbaceae bacterium]|nr:MAG: TIGR01777 family protein [Desulfobulbaceae bacterium]
MTTPPAAPTIVLTGATGFVGSHLKKALLDQGYRVIGLGRADLGRDAESLAAKMAGAVALINLAGAPVITRWSETYKEKMRQSRIDLTQKLIDAMALMAAPPAVFISTSAVGYYASHCVHSEEKGRKGEGFLSDLAHDWEQTALQAEKHGIRTVIFRFAVVLGRNGGALQKMILPFKLGLGGVIGTGKQAFSWIHLNDLLRAHFAALDSPSYRGIYNLTAPKPTTNYHFTKTLGRVLHRPTILPVPTFMLKMVFGEGATILVDGQAAVPKRLLDNGFVFDFPELEDALRNCVKADKT